MNPREESENVCPNCGYDLPPFATSCDNCGHALHEAEKDVSTFLKVLPGYFAIPLIIIGMFTMVFSLPAALCFLLTGSLFFDRFQASLRKIGVPAIPGFVPVLLLVLPLILFFVFLPTIVKIGHSRSKRVHHSGLQNALRGETELSKSDKEELWNQVEKFVREQTDPQRQVHLTGHERVKIERTGPDSVIMRNGYLSGNNLLLGRREMTFSCRVRVLNDHLLLYDLTFSDWVTGFQRFFFFPYAQNQGKRQSNQE